MSGTYRIQASGDNETELRRPVSPEDTVLPVLSVASLAPAGRVRLGQAEFVTYTGVGQDVVGQPTLTGCIRGAAREQGGSEARAWRGGTRVVQAPYERPELVAELPAPSVDQAGRQVYLEEREPRLSFIGEGSGLRDLTTPEFWRARFISSFGGPGSGAGQFNGELRGITVRGDTGQVYVSSDNRVQTFSANGTYVSTLAGSGSGNGQVDTPWGLFWQPFSNPARVIVVDAGNHRVQAFLNDVYEWKFGSQGTGTNNYASPRHVVSVLPEPFTGSLPYFITDQDIDTRLKVLFFSAGTGIGIQTYYPITDQLEEPYGLAVRGKITNDTNLLTFAVSDLATDQVYVRKDSQAEFVIGGPGSNPGEFDQPLGLAFDAQHNLYVCDSGNHRVQVFDAAGSIRGMFGGYGDGDGQFDTPTAIAITDDYIYVCDSGNRRVQQFQNPLSGQGFIVGEAQTTWAPGTISANTGAFTSLTVPGARNGDYVEVAWGGNTSNNVHTWLTGKVLGDDNVLVVLHSKAGGNITTTSGVLKVRVSR